MKCIYEIFSWIESFVEADEYLMVHRRLNRLLREKGESAFH